MTQVSQNRRQIARRRTLMGGTLRFAARTGTMSCVVRNLSAGGARLDFDNPLWLPESFDVDIPHQNIRAAAKVIWRGPNALGVAFETPVVAFRGAESEAVATNDKAAVAMTPDRAGQERLSFLERERLRLEARIRQLTEDF